MFVNGKVFEIHNCFTFNSPDHIDLHDKKLREGFESRHYCIPIREKLGNDFFTYCDAIFAL